jgi:hypothetical protein
MIEILKEIGKVFLVLYLSACVICTLAMLLVIFFGNIPEGTEINQAEERLRANKKAAKEAEEKLEGYKKC